MQPTKDAQAEVADMAQTIKLLRDQLTAVTLERDALKRTLRTARNIIVDTQNFIHPTQVWRDTELMQRVIDKFLGEIQP